VIGRTTGLPLTCMSWRLLPSASQVSTRSEGCGPSLPSSSASTYLAKRTGHTRHRWKLVELLGEDEPTCGPRRSATVAHETRARPSWSRSSRSAPTSRRCSGPRCSDEHRVRSTSSLTLPSSFTSKSPTSTTMDLGESIAETAIGEVREETGFTIEVVGIVGIYTDPSASSNTATARFDSSSTSALSVDSAEAR
jgi:hypothetical protein